MKKVMRDRGFQMWLVCCLFFSALWAGANHAAESTQKDVLLRRNKVKVAAPENAGLPVLEGRSDRAFYDRTSETMRLEGRSRLAFNGLELRTQKPLWINYTKHEMRALKTRLVHPAHQMVMACEGMVVFLKKETSFKEKRVAKPEDYGVDLTRAGTSSSPSESSFFLRNLPFQTIHFKGPLLLASRTATVKAKEGVYCGETYQLILKGGVRVVFGKHMLEGGQVIYHMQKGLIEIQGEPKKDKKSNNAGLVQPLPLQPIQGIVYIPKKPVFFGG